MAPYNVTVSCNILHCEDAVELIKLHFYHEWNLELSFLAAKDLHVLNFRTSIDTTSSILLDSVDPSFTISGGLYSFCIQVLPNVIQFRGSMASMSPSVLLSFPMCACVQESFWKKETDATLYSDFDLPNATNIIALSELKTYMHYCCIGKVKWKFTYFLLGIPATGEHRVLYKYFQAIKSNQPYHNTINKRIRDNPTNSAKFNIQHMQPGIEQYQLTTFQIMIFSANLVGAVEARNNWDKELGFEVFTTQRRKKARLTNTICVPMQSVDMHLLRSGGVTDQKLKNQTIRCDSAGDARIEQLPKDWFLHKKNIAETLYPISQYEQSKEVGSFANLVNAEDLVKAIEVLSLAIPGDINDPDAIIGAVLTEFYEDVSWSAAPCKTISARFKDMTYDIDQVISVVRSITWLNDDAQLDNESEYLTWMENQLRVQEVLGPSIVANSLLAHRVTVNEKDFKSGAKQGGHSYMAAAERKKYFGLVAKNAMPDIFKISIKFPNLSTDVAMECIWQATITVCKYLEANNPQGIAASLSFGVQAGYSHEICAGPMLPLLTCLLLIKCHNAVNICMESYGGKSRSHVSPADINSISDSYMSEVANQIMDKQRGNSPFLIERFTTFLEKEFTTSETKFSWGIGCTCSTVGVDGKSTYAWVNCNVVPFAADIKNSINYYDGNNIVGNNNIEENETPLNDMADIGPGEKGEEENDIELATGVVDSQQNTDIKPFVPLKFREYNSFPVLGNTLPVEQQPSTIIGTNRNNLLCVPGIELKIKNISRIQQYSPTIRNAIGEVGVSDKCTTKAASSHVNTFYKDENALISTSKTTERIDEFLHNGRLFTKQLQLRGSYARVEVLFTVNANVERTTVLIDGFHDVHDIVMKHTQSLDAGLLSQYIDLLLSAYKSRLALLVDMVQNYTHRHDRMDEYFPLLLDLKKVIYSFYSGKALLKDKYISSSRLAYCAGRPIFIKSPELMSITRKKCLEIVPGYDWYGQLLHNLSVISGKLFIPKQSKSRALLLDNSFGSVYERVWACSICFNIFSATTMPYFCEHSCKTYQKGKALQCDGADYKIMLARKYEELTDEQRSPFKLIESKNNIFITGPAGSGKSTCVRCVIAHLYRQYGSCGLIVAATTKIAAKIIGGNTLHHVMGLADEPIDSINVTEVIRNLQLNHPERYHRIRACKVFFIDEVSTVSKFAYQKFHNMVSLVHNDDKNPVIFILSGDVLQLPPIPPNQKTEIKFFFQSKEFYEGKFTAVYVKGNKRCDKFNDTLLRLRDGGENVTPYDLDVVNTKMGGNIPFNVAMVYWFVYCEWLQLTYQALSPIKKDSHMQRLRYTKSMYDTNRELMVLQDYKQAEKNALNHFERLPLGPQIDFSHFMALTPRNTEVALFFDYCTTNLVHLTTAIDAVDEFANVNNSSVPVSRNAQVELSRVCKFKQILNLHIGQRVRILSNSAHALMANNDLGIIDRIEDSVIHVLPLMHGWVAHALPIEKQSYKVSIAECCLTRFQFPLIPCYAVNTPAVQGMTLTGTPGIFCNASMSRINGFGLRDSIPYTYMTRYTDPADFLPMFVMTAADFVSHPEALKFDRAIRVHHLIALNEHNCL